MRHGNAFWHWFISSYCADSLTHILHSSIDIGPYNQSYMPGWGEAMGGRVLFMNEDTKDVMIEENSHWQMSSGKKKMWHPDCLLTDFDGDKSSEESGSSGRCGCLDEDVHCRCQVNKEAVA